MRFDYRGMGDSDGSPRTFQEIEEDIRAAVDAFCQWVPEMTQVVLWGLCDAVPPSIFYAPTDTRVSGLVLVNPFAYTMDGQARTFVKHYYWSRLKQPDYWLKVFSGRFDAWASLKSIFQVMSVAFSTKESAERLSPNPACPLPDRMRMTLEGFKGRFLVILSGNDLVAREFNDTVARSKNWQNLLASERVTKHSVPEANHTFSRREWRDEVASVTATWVRSF
jgi:exosortase A-associated hydrolase 1